jgi:hypothetical protein
MDQWSQEEIQIFEKYFDLKVIHVHQFVWFVLMPNLIQVWSYLGIRPTDLALLDKYPDQP